MNKTRRQAIESTLIQLQDIQERLEGLRDEEQEYMDNMPENMQQGEKYSNAESAVDALDSAQNSVSEAISYCEDAISN